MEIINIKKKSKWYTPWKNKTLKHNKDFVVDKTSVIFDNPITLNHGEKFIIQYIIKQEKSQ